MGTPETRSVPLPPKTTKPQSKLSRTDLLTLASLILPLVAGLVQLTKAIIEAATK